MHKIEKHNSHNRQVNKNNSKMAVYKLKRKNYTVWDDTDNLKRMKDADILAEKKKTNSYAPIVKQAATGAAAGLGAGVVLGATKGLFKPGVNAAGRQVSRLSAMGRGAAKFGKAGAMIGGLTAGVMAYNKGSKQAKDNEFYNQRLEYAKRQALRRERADWKTNMTQREGYSY